MGWWELSSFLPGRGLRWQESLQCIKYQDMRTGLVQPGCGCHRLTTRIYSIKGFQQGLGTVSDVARGRLHIHTDVCMHIFLSAYLDLAHASSGPLSADTSATKVCIVSALTSCADILQRASRRCLDIRLRILGQSGAYIGSVNPILNRP